MRFFSCLLFAALGAVVSEQEEKQCRREDHEESCGEGFFVGLVKQPDLNLRHFPASKPLVFAEMLWGRCFTEYSVLCNASGKMEVLEARGGCSDTTVKTTALGMSWEVCALRSTLLKTRQDLIDLTFDSATPEGATVDGCIRLWPAEGLPHLGNVRGTMDEQKDALATRKGEVGGCPTWREHSEVLQRGRDFAAGGNYVLGLAVKEYQRYLISTAKGMLQNGPHDGFRGFGLMGAIIALKDFKNTEAFLAFTKANCGVALPLGLGVIAPAKYGPTADALQDHSQKRMYVGPWNSGVSDICFHPTIPLFLSTGSEEHTQTRRMWDAAGLATMHEGDLPDIDFDFSWSRYFRNAIGVVEPTEGEVALLIVPLLLERVFGKKPSKEEAKAITEYATFGKLCIKSKLMSSIPFFPSKIQAIRASVMSFAMDSPMAKKIAVLLETADYAALKLLYASSGEPVLELAIRNLADAALFAGLVGTTDMTWKCVKMQHRDSAHVRMFRTSPINYLWELMRVQPAVQGFVTTVPFNRSLRLFFEDVPVPAGMPYKFSNSMANRDPAVFSDPSGFHPDRPWTEMGNILSWNGQLKHVIEKSYAKAPRHCPGHDLSVKIAEKVCKHLTRSLPNWGHDVTDPSLEGPVQIIEQGEMFGRKGVAMHFDYVLEKRCVVDRFKNNAVLGCYSDSSLEPLTPLPNRSRGLLEELAQCPGMVHTTLTLAEKGYEKLLKTLLGRKAPPLINQPWADDFTVALYSSIAHLTLRQYSSRHASSVPVPITVGGVPTFTIGDISAPNKDIDHPVFVPLETFVPQRLFNLVFLPGFNCFHGLLRTLPWHDALDEEKNTWEYVFEHAEEKYSSKKDWVLSWYKPYKTLDGSPIWPQQQLDFTALYWKQDTWDDGLERAIAFGLIGAHRLELSGQALPFVIRINRFSALEVREGFGNYEGDLYFTAEGVPAIMELAGGRQIQRGDKDWQYWKFVWRSALITVITLVDHLHLAHFRAGNILARAVRKTLSPKHPMRRFLSIFTFGTIFVNMNAMHTLIGPSHVLHRSGPFKNFEALSKLVPESLPSPFEQHHSILSQEAFDRLPKMMKEAPYYQDGRLLVVALRRFIEDFGNVYWSDICDSDGRMKDFEMSNFREALVQDINESRYQTPIKTNTNCKVFFDILVSYLWTVTGWHRHVGTVADYYADPDLASFSWKKGEPFARPRQHFQMSTVAAFTGLSQPKLSEDYSHVFQGIYKEEQAVRVFQTFKAGLELISKEIGRRNEIRMSTLGFKNTNADPTNVECSVAV